MSDTIYTADQLQAAKEAWKAAKGNRSEAKVRLRNYHGLTDEKAIESALNAAAAETTFPKPPQQVKLVDELAVLRKDSVPPPIKIPEARFVDPLPDVPGVMKAKRQWVRWRLETRGGKLTKVPYQVNGNNASSSDSNTWTDYRTAVMGATINHEQGVGFMFANEFAGIDLDGCRNPKTDEITPWADDIIQSIDNVYVEVSPSGTGLHIFVLGKVPGADKKFNLNPAIGYGKAAIEIYDEHRYFTVTGNSFFEDAGDVIACDLAGVYQKFHDLRRDNPAPRDERTESADAGEPTKAKWHGLFHCSKYDIFKRGEILSPSHPFVIDNRIGQLEYPSQSEADLAFCTILAIMHDGDADKVWDEYCDSSMVREKWLTREDDFRRLTIAKAIESAKKVKEKDEKKPMDLTPLVETSASAPILLTTQTQAASVEISQGAETTLEDIIANAVAMVTEAEKSDSLTEEAIPAFDDSVITGIFRDIVEIASGGTTIPRQFPFLIAKVYVGSRMASGMTFEGIEDSSTVYGTSIGETGTSKGLSWNRTMLQTLMPKALLDRKLKLFNSADSGAGLRDTFFDKPEGQPVMLYIDEVRSLGHKAGEKKNPEIVDMIIELANSHSVSRVKAKKTMRDKAKTNENAFLSVYMCGQNGEAYMSSFPGRTEMGLWDRFYPEYSPVIEAGRLPKIDPTETLKLLAELEKLSFKGHMNMAEGVEDALDNFWLLLPREIRTTVRFKIHLMFDMYFSAWSQGRTVASLEDLAVAIKIFRRQIVIRLVHFHDEVPDRIGHYIGLLKRLTESMRKRLNKGASMESVAMSLRDFQTDTHAYRDNEIATFNTAWRNFHEVHLATYKFTARNGHEYTKYLPMPYEDEMWAATPEAKVAFDAA